MKVLRSFPKVLKIKSETDPIKEELRKRLSGVPAISISLECGGNRDTE